MGRAEGTGGDDAFFPQNARDRMDLGHFERLFEGHGGHDAGDAAGEHGLAGAGRADEQEVVVAADGDLERALGDRLPLDEGEVELLLPGGGRRAVAGDGQRREGREAAQMVHRLRERGSRIRLDPLDVRRLARVARGDDELAVPARLGGDEQGQDARDGAQRAVQRQLAQKDVPRRKRGLELAGRGEDAHGDGEVEVRPLLAQVGGGEVDGHLAGREGLAAVFEGGANTLAALLDGGVWQADQLVAGQAALYVRLHLDGDALEAGQGKTGHFG